MNLRQRYQRLTVWNKVAVWGSLASILGVVLYFVPQRRVDAPRQITNIDRSPAAMVMQPGRDIIIHPPAPSSSQAARPLLMPQQERLLELLVGYQKRFGASKLIVSRTDGRLHFDDDPGRGADVSLIRDLFGTVNPHNVGRFEELVQGMPSEYVRLIAEARWDNPLVLNVTEAGVAYLAGRR